MDLQLQVPPQPTLPLPPYLDSTMITCARSCMRKFYWNFILNKVPRGENIHFIAGGAFAAALDAVRKAQGSANRMLTHEELCEAALPVFLRAWGDYQAPESHAKTLWNVWYALEEYFQRYHPYTDPVQPLKLASGVATEFSFAIPIPVTHPSGEPFLYCGKFDLLGTYGGRTTVLDDKTTGYFTAHWERLWMMRGQFIGYVWACQQLGYETDDCIVRGTALMKTGVQFLDCPLTFPRHIIDRWFEELCLTAERIKQHYEANYWPYDFAESCSAYGGCPYMDLCVAKDPEAWLNNYQDRTWAPINVEDVG